MQSLTNNYKMNPMVHPLIKTLKIVPPSEAPQLCPFFDHNQLLPFSLAFTITSPLPFYMLYHLIMPS